jgi:hypothetical protein
LTPKGIEAGQRSIFFQPRKVATCQKNEIFWKKEAEKREAKKQKGPYIVALKEFRLCQFFTGDDGQGQP